MGTRRIASSCGGLFDKIVALIREALSRAERMAT